MKQSLISLFCLLCLYSLQAQPSREKKYPSLLWEISGNGLKKPSYLIGTMHVSSKLAFHLPDSFYFAVRNVQVVALETNPETWQEDMSKYEFGSDELSGYGNFYGKYSSMPSDYLGINTLKFFKYDNKIARALFSNPSAINNLLYRSYGNDVSDFEEDTYLDMYIFQCGKKWGKKISGVENYGESMQLMAEAYKDAARDKNRKERSYGDWDDAYSADKLQEAYRLGNLDLLDSINKYNSISAAFDEKFLYRRNEIQSASIDSILRSGATLFVGVGAAHLPGNRGVIELLRKKGYRLRPVKMGERASKEKDLVDKVRVPVNFRTETSADGFFKVDIPGKFYKFGEDESLNQLQYADMSNGSYYVVTRVMTNAWMWGHSSEKVYGTIDSLLYENIPGKIISKTTIYRNGYKGFDIVNRTRRGDLQRYHIFITPFEVILFKMSGNGDYIRTGTEAERFFGSIQFKEFKNNEPTLAPGKKYSPPFGGFAVDLPHDPYIGNDGSWIFDASDKTSGTHYRVIRTDIHNYHFIEEDSFDLDLMNESFMASDFIDKQLTRKFVTYNGYPALEGKYRDKSGSVYLTRFILQGPHYYTLIAHGKQENAGMQRFLSSFEIKPFVYGDPQLHRDTSLYFTVQSPVFPEEKKIRLNIPKYSWMGSDDEENDEEDLLEGGIFRNRTIRNDSTGEKIYVSFFRSSRYAFTKDSAALDRNNRFSYLSDTSFVYKLREKSILPDNTRTWEAIITDTGSSRTLWTRVFYKDGIGFSIATESDTVTAPSQFVKTFFRSFTPDDSLSGVNPYVKKASIFFADLKNSDTVIHNRAIKHIGDINLDSSDLTGLMEAIGALNWKEKKYLDAKSSFIEKLGRIKTNAGADYLKQLYYAVEDTVRLQYAVLENLLNHKTRYAYGIFRDIINTEPPVLDYSSVDPGSYTTSEILRMYNSGFEYNDGKFMDELFDSLALTRTILSDLLPLINLEDYKPGIMKLLGRMIEEGLVEPKDYETCFSKLLLEARQELKKQSIAEKKRSIEKAEEIKTDKKKPAYLRDDDEKDAGNDDLSLYATLLLPFSEKNSAVNTLLQQMLQSSDKELKYNTLLLLLENEKTYPDSLLNWFGQMDEYRYKLYTDLKEKGKPNLFPAQFNNPIDLGRSALLDKKSYGKPDSILFLDRLPLLYKNKDGFIYFFKYKSKKDDLVWKLATAGLVPADGGAFEFDETAMLPGAVSLYEVSGARQYDFTRFSDTKLKDDEPVNEQLRKEMKKMLYSRRKSAKEFYSEENNRSGASDDMD